MRKLYFIKYERNNRKIWTLMMSILMVLAMLMTNVTCSIAAGNRLEEKKLYMYGNRELAGFFKDIGYQDFWYNDIRISRNSDGTALRFLSKEKKKILIAKCDGSITVIDSPGYQTWLNDANQPVIWLTWSDNKSTAHYANGMSEKMPFTPDSGHDPSGKYFMKDAPEKQCYTTIYSTERPDMPLIKVNLCGVTKIFVKNKRIYLAGKRYETNGAFVNEVRIFQEKERLLEQVDSIVVPRPTKSVARYYMYYPVDMCPWNDEILFLNAHDFPTRSVWYSFDIKTRQLKEVGKMSIWGGQAFYLQCDIIKKVIEAQKKKK